MPAPVLVYCPDRVETWNFSERLVLKKFFVSVVWRVLVMFVGCPLAIRIEEKGEGFENGNCFCGIVV